MLFDAKAVFMIKQLILSWSSSEFDASNDFSHILRAEPAKPYLLWMLPRSRWARRIESFMPEAFKFCNSDDFCLISDSYCKRVFLNQSKCVLKVNKTLTLVVKIRRKNLFIFAKKMHYLFIEKSVHFFINS